MMTRISRYRILSILIALLLVVGGVSYTSAENFAGETSADFLKIGIGAQSAGMGGAYTAMADGALTSFWNPANLSRSERGEVVFGHQSWLQDLSLEYGAVSFGLGEKWNGNASLVYMDYGDIPGYDIYGNSTGQISAYDFMASVSSAYQINERLSAGLTVKMIRQQLDQISASTIAGDLGVQFSEGIWRAGLVLANIGGEMNFESVSAPLPSEIRLGLAVRPFAQDFVFASDMSKRFDGGLKLANGVQVGFEGQYYLRSGFEYLQTGTSSSWQSTVSSGAGMQVGEYSIDYSFTFGNDLTNEDLHRFSFGYRFN